MTTAIQQELYLKEPDAEQVLWLLDRVKGRGWIRAAEILRLSDIPDTENNRRWLRSLANASAGRVAGGDKGYKLTSELTAEEFEHWRNRMRHQTEEMTHRINEAEKVYYGSHPVGSNQS